MDEFLIIWKKTVAVAVQLIGGSFILRNVKKEMPVLTIYITNNWLINN